MEARVGIEPTYKGFADLSLTTWVPRRTVQITAWEGKTGGAGRNRTGDRGFADLGLTTWLPRPRKKPSLRGEGCQTSGAGDGI